MAKILTLGKGKNKREWELTEEEFREFECRFEENELIEIGPEFLKGKLTLVDPPTI